MPRKILIINFHSGKNAGDLALLLTTLQILNEVFENPEVKVSANWLNEDCYTEYGIDAIPSFRSILESISNKSVFHQIVLFVFLFAKMSFFALLKPIRKIIRQKSSKFSILAQAFEQSDLIVAVSGNQVYSSGKYGWPLPVTLAPFFFARMFKKLLVVFPQSIGPLERRWEEILVKKAYEYADKIFVREYKSLELLEELGLENMKYSYAPDIAFGLVTPDAKNGYDLLLKHGISMNKPRVGITLISRMGKALNQDNLSRYYLSIENVLTDFCRQIDAQVVLFTQVHGPSKLEDDRIPTRELYLSLKNRGIDVVFIEEQISPMILKVCYSYMDCLIASRLHSGIFAFSIGVPTLFIGYFSKTEGVTDALGWSDLFININEINQTILKERLEYLWKNRKILVEHIKQTNVNIISELGVVENYLRTIKCK